MTYEFFNKTRSLKPFASVEEFEQFERDLISTTSTVPLKPNAAMHKATAKKGTALGVSFDSFAEFTFKTYQEKVKHAIVERNLKAAHLSYVDDTGKVRKWYPDFIVNGVYFEVKGIVRPKDECKRRQHPEVEWVYQPDIKQMAKELDTAFGKEWRDEFIERH